MIAFIIFCAALLLLYTLYESVIRYNNHRLKVWKHWISNHSLYDVMLKREEFKQKNYTIKKPLLMGMFDDILYRLSCNLPSYDTVVRVHEKFPEAVFKQVTEQQLIRAGKTPEPGEVFSDYSKPEIMIGEDCLRGIRLTPSLTICPDVRKIYLDAEDSEVLAQRWQKSFLTMNDAINLLKFINRYPGLAKEILDIEPEICFRIKNPEGKLPVYRIKNGTLLHPFPEDEAKKSNTFCFIVKY